MLHVLIPTESSSGNSYQTFKTYQFFMLYIKFQNLIFQILALVGNMKLTS